jgi:hypothetical protein
VTVTGGLPREVVQRIVRQRAGAWRACYERALSRIPTLGGRIKTRFVIELDGTVSNVVNVDSDLPDPNLVTCLTATYEDDELSFPQPETGPITVVVPLELSPPGFSPE